MVEKRKPQVGVLALQGDFARHEKSLRAAGAQALPVRVAADLEGCRGLVIPGGESTTLMHLAREGGLVKPLRAFASRGAIMGTCAGLIVLSRQLAGSSMGTLGLLDIRAERNGFGRQAESFMDKVDLNLDGRESRMEGVFIRAPRILDVGEGVRILGYWREEAVMVRSGRILALTFHPELTADYTIHRYFVNNMVMKNAHTAGAA